MEFRLLGSLEFAGHAGPVRPGGAKQRVLLALLLLHANEVVSRDALIAALWPEQLPADAGHSLDIQVSRLRRALGPEATLSTRGTGYVLEVDPEAIDARRFERLARRRSPGQRRGRSGDGARGARRRARALARRPAGRRRVRGLRPL